MTSSTNILFKLLFFALKFSLRHQENLLPLLKSLLYFNKKLRVSVAALLLIEGDDQYVLIKNHHRGEYYGPIGGVYKHTNKKPEVLDKIEWVADYTTHHSKKADMKNDLRGVIYGKRLPEFINWFTSRKGRENEQCLYRELKEELQEGKVGKILRDRSSDIKIELFRQIIEGPRSVEDRDYSAQFRYFEIFKPDRSDMTTDSVVREIIQRADHGGNNLIMVNKGEILRGRMNQCGSLVASSAKYYFSSKWHANEPVRY